MDQTTVSLFLGLGGIGGTLVGSLVAPRLTARQSRKDELRRDQRQLYVDALVHVEVFARRVDARADLYYGDGSSSAERERSEKALVARDQITARMTLIGHPEVEEAWRHMLGVDESWENYWTEGLDYDPKLERDGLGDDDQWVRRARVAVAAVQRACRDQLGRER